MESDLKKTISFREIVHPLRRNWKAALLAFLSVMLTVGFLTFRTRPVYEASATLSVQQKSGLDEIYYTYSNVLAQRNFIKNQMAILESRTLANNVVFSLHERGYEDSLGLFGKTSAPQSFPIKKIIAGLLKKNTEEPLPIQIAVDRFQKLTRATNDLESDIIYLKGRSNNPVESALLVNMWVNAYQEYSRSGSRSDILDTRQFLESKLKEIEIKLARSEEDLASFKQMNKVIALPTETEQLVMQLSSFQSQYDQSRTEMDAVKQQLSFLMNQLDESKKHLVEDMTRHSNPVLMELQKQLADLVARKVGFEAQLTAAHLDIETNAELKSLEQRIEGIKKEIISETTKLVDSDLSYINPLDYSENLINQILTAEIAHQALVAKTAALKNIVDEYAQKFDGIPATSLTLARLERDVKTYENLYIMYKEKYEETRIQDAGQTNFIRVVDLAEVPVNPVFPNKKLNFMLAFFFGTLFAVGLAFGLDMFSDRIRNDDDIEQMRMEVIGRIPFAKNAHYRVKFHGRKEDLNIFRAKQIFPYLLTNRKHYSQISEAYRTLRTAVYLSCREKKLHTILVSSPGAEEGKSTTIVNLAIATAQKGVRTLLIDSDLRKPVLDVLLLGSRRGFGLVNILERTMGFDEAIRETTIPGLYLLPAGLARKNASELLGSPVMSALIAEAKKRFNMVFFDSPPLLPVTDAMVLAPVVDGIILVVRSEWTTKDHLKRAMMLLNHANTTFLGTVLTGLSGSDVYGYKDYFSAYAEITDEKYHKKNMS